MSYTKRITISPRHRAMLGFGDGPVTSPAQVDVPVPDDTVIVGEVTPKRVSCDDLSADSPFRRPGQVCAPDPTGPTLIDRLVAWLAPAPTTTTAAPTVSTQVTAPAPQESALPTLALLAIAGGGAYYLYKSSKKKRSA